MHITEYGAEHARTLLFLPCTAEPVWAFSATVALLARRWHVFQVSYDGHEPAYPGDFLSVEQTVAEIMLWLRSRGITWLDAAYGCSLGGACLTRLLALGELRSGARSSTAASRRISCRFRCAGSSSRGTASASGSSPAAAGCWRRPSRPERFIAAGARPESGVRRAAGVSQDLLPPDGSQRVLVGKQLCPAPHARGDGDENHLLVRRR